VADYLLSGVSPSPSPFALQPAKPNFVPEEEADDQIDPNQENILFILLFIYFISFFGNTLCQRFAQFAACNVVLQEKNLCLVLNK
jgi:hypothetical protein